MNNKVIIAGAGAGKTTFLVNEAIKNCQENNVLITTFTHANRDEIKKKFIEKIGYIPANITIQTWFSFLLQHGLKPYQSVLFEKKIKGLILVSGQSGVKMYKNPCQDCKEKKIVNYDCNKCKNPIYFSEEKEFENHYFTKDLKIYSDKLSKFVFRCNEKSKGEVIDRISRIYPYIYIDEFQDLSGYDLEVLDFFFKGKSKILLVGDPRQSTYSTNNNSKNAKYKGANIIDFFKKKEKILEIDVTSLSINYRCNKDICELSNKLFQNYEPISSNNNDTDTEHCGVFNVCKDEIDEYLQKYNPIQLRHNRQVKVNQNFRVMNFGDSKGLTFDRVLIYPTKEFCKWLKDNNKELKETSRSKFYVALTRARYSVAIVID
ncbi:UvrD-helicase domain-containing protein [Capnocytophaga stomatis]|uniref:UvrD-helicase domain-containing protein n=1 Tax=Capnocytophaga stomatis TaxID=1848904 RepID=UPI001ACCE541|nr:UvrD-helicase domain-containing protein [Capnocytophaga stomatis]GIM50155.1 hypothetical protein CAPN003_16070 [Capnocytophaga stomatis]